MENLKEVGGVVEVVVKRYGPTLSPKHCAERTLFVLARGTGDVWGRTVSGVDGVLKDA